jgi:hypothetical protein
MLDYGGFEYTLLPGFYGYDFFTSKANDGLLDSNTATTAIWVPRKGLSYIEPDQTTPFNAAEVQAAIGGDVVLKADAAGKASISAVSATANPAPAGSYPPRINPAAIPAGFFHFQVEGVPHGGAATVTIHLPPGLPNDQIVYYKHGATPNNTRPHWYSFRYDPADGIYTGAETHYQNASIPPGEIVLHFIDSQLGDDDLRANGFILDDGGPAFLAGKPASLTPGPSLLPYPPFVPPAPTPRPSPTLPPSFDVFGQRSIPSASAVTVASGFTGATASLPLPPEPLADAEGASLAAHADLGGGDDVLLLDEVALLDWLLPRMPWSDVCTEPSRQDVPSTGHSVPSADREVGDANVAEAAPCEEKGERPIDACSAALEPLSQPEPNATPRDESGPEHEAAALGVPFALPANRVTSVHGASAPERDQSRWRRGWGLSSHSPASRPQSRRCC